MPCSGPVEVSWYVGGTYQSNSVSSRSVDHWISLAYWKRCSIFGFFGWSSETVTRVESTLRIFESERAQESVLQIQNLHKCSLVSTHSQKHMYSVWDGSIPTGTDAPTHKSDMDQPLWNCTRNRVLRFWVCLNQTRPVLFCAHVNYNCKWNILSQVKSFA